MADEGLEVCRAFRNNGRCRYGDECKFDHSEGDRIEPPARGQCHNWEKDGECSFGDNCRFLHGEDDTRHEKKEGEKKKKKRSRGPRKPRNNDEPREKLDEECQNYLAGKCYYGDNCRRTHVGDVELQPVVKIDEICNNFLSGRCRFNELCRRQHPEGQEGTAE